MSETCPSCSRFVDEAELCPHDAPVCDRCCRDEHMATDHAEYVRGEYRTPEWYEARRGGITASEIAAVLGISPWVSPFDLWWLKQTGEESQPDTADMRRGHRYEAIILEDFAEDHPDLILGSPGLVRNSERPWQMCTPDALAYENRMHAKGEPVAVVQAKSGARRDEWGDAGTDDIPVHYRAQVLWEMDTLGLNVAYVPVLFGFDYREYVVEYDEADATFMRKHAEEFLASLAENKMPDIDDSTATARRLKRLHPDVREGAVEVPTHILAQYHAAKRLRDTAEARMRLNENRLRALIGDQQVATVDGRKVASRSVYDVRERTQTVSAHTVNRLNITKPREERAS